MFKKIENSNQFSYKHFNKLFGLCEIYIIKNKNLIYLDYSLNIKQFNSQFFINILVEWISLNNYKNLQDIGKNPDYKITLDIILSCHTNIYIPWISSNLMTNYSTLQLQKIKNKKMQLNWMWRNVYLNRVLISFTDRWFKHLNLLCIKGLLFNVKGRAADLRWVKLRYWKKSPITITKYCNNLYRTVASSDYFVTKWGSTSIKIQISYLKYQRVI